MRSRTAFTIIELLVVISIIALLISILLPSLAGARDRARFIKWAGYSHNLRIDTRMRGYYNFEQQTGTETNNAGDLELWNRAAGDPNEQAKQDIEPAMFNLSKVGAVNTPDWDFTEGRWKGKGAMHFDGSQRIGLSHADSEHFYFGTGAFAAMAWVKFDVGAVPGCCNNVISANNLADSQPGWALFSDTNFFRTRTASNGGTGHLVGNHAQLQEKRWYHVAVSRDFEGNLRLYYNGELTGPTGNVQTGSTTPTTDKGGFRLGHDTANGNWPLKGYIDEAAVYKDSLEAEDVETMFSVGQRRVTN